MRNLNRITNYYNRVEAWKDWKRAADEALRLGLVEEVKRLRPADDAPWRKIDRSTAALKEIIEKECVE
jgi:hypothetical protein